MQPNIRRSGALALLILIGLMVSACTNPFASQPSPTVGTSLMAEGAVTAYPAPATPTPPTATSPTAIPPTAIPPTATSSTAIPPTVPPPSATRPALTPSLVGPEWTVAYSGDLNADGRPDVVAYKPGAVAPGPSFRRPEYAGYVGSVSEAVIVQADAAGQPQVLVTMSRSGVAPGGRVVVGFPSSREAWNNPVAVMLLIDTNQPPVVAALPVNSSGEPYTQAVGVRWNRSRAAYELISGGK